MKAQEIKEQLKAEGLWDEDKQWIIDKMTDIEDLASDILSSQSDNRFQLEFEPDFFHKQQGRIKSNLHKIDGTSIYFTIQDFRVNFNKDFETHCQKHGIDDKRGFLTGLKDAYDFVLSEYESVSENALLLTYKEKDCFGLDESEIKGYADKKAQTLLYHLEAIIKEIEDRIKDIDERADAIISNSLSSPAPEDDAQSLPPNPIKTKADILKEQLSQYGFFELEKVKTLSEQSKVSIIEKIAKSGLPYAIAMFDYLGFIQYLEANHFDTKYKLNREVSKWFNSDEEGRAVKGNISSLLKNTTENKNRYTAYKHKENVIKDYELLK